MRGAVRLGMVGSGFIERRVISDAHGRLIEATESRYPADRHALDVRFDVEVPDPAPARIGG